MGFCQCAGGIDKVSRKLRELEIWDWRAGMSLGISVLTVETMVLIQGKNGTG